MTTSADLPVHAWVIRIVACLGALFTATAVLAQVGAGATAPQPAYLPFVEASGMVTTNLRRSVVVRTLGPPSAGGPPSLLRYPQLGLSFAMPGDTPPGERWGSDPPVLWMQVLAPSRAQTFGGLQVGQSQALAMEALTRDYKVLARTMSAVTGAPPIGLRVTDLEQRSKRELEVRFEGGVVTSLQFNTHDPAKARDPTRRTLFQLPPHLVIIALAVTALSLVSTFLAEKAGVRRRWRFPGRVAGPLGLAVFAVGGVALVISVLWLRDGDAVTRFAGLLGLTLAGGAGLVGLSLMAQSGSRAYAWPAKAGLALVIVAVLLNQTGWFGS